MINLENIIVLNYVFYEPVLNIFYFSLLIETSVLEKVMTEMSKRPVSSYSSFKNACNYLMSSAFIVICNYIHASIDYLVVHLYIHNSNSVGMCNVLIAISIRVIKCLQLKNILII